MIFQRKRLPTAWKAIGTTKPRDAAESATILVHTRERSTPQLDPSMTTGKAPSLYELLSARCLPSTDDKPELSHFRALAGRLLGVAPSFASLAQLSPPTLRVYLTMLRPCFGIPAVDFHCSPVSTALRREVILQSSLTHNCAYCISHCAGFGDVLGGSLPLQCARGGSFSTLANGSASSSGSAAPEARTNDKATQQVLALVRAACSFPSSVTESMKDDVRDSIGDHGYSQVVSILCFMGWLNFAMDSCGTRIELPVIPFAQEVLTDVAPELDLSRFKQDGTPTPAVRHQVAHARYAARTETGRQAADSNGRTLLQTLTAWLENAFQVLGLVPSVMRALAYEKTVLTGIPSTNDALDAWSLQNLGVSLEIVMETRDVNLKRMLCLGLRESFLSPSAESGSMWQKVQKLALLFAFGKSLGNDVLKQSAKLMMHAAQKDKELVVREADVKEFDAFCASSPVANSSDASSNFGSEFQSAARFVAACGGRGGGLSEANIADVSTISEPGKIVEVVGLIGFFGFLHRLSVLGPVS